LLNWLAFGISIISLALKTPWLHPAAPPNGPKNATLPL
jgi:hypothetical protein